jgi:hypothetical protein
MRGAPRERFGLVALLGLLALLATACTNGISGQPKSAALPELSAGDSISQSLLNFGEAATVRYKGSLSTSSDDKVTFDVTVSMAGEVLGTISMAGQAASVIVINKTLYLKAPGAFWTALRGLGGGDSKGSVLADRWVKAPAVLLGIEFGEIFTPDVVSQHLLKDPKKGGDDPLRERPKTTEGSLEVIKIPVDAGSAYLAAKAPYGVAKLELSKFGNTDNTKVSDLVAEVTDVSADTTKFYQDLAAQAGALTTAVDALTTVQQGAHRFDGCGAASCSLIVEFTNTAKVPVRVHIKADWTGDNAPLGACEVQVGPIAPGAPGSATCILNSPQWAQFWQRAHSVVGTHPYGATWAPLVLADAPDLSSITAKATAQAADMKNPKTDGSHFVYSISYGDTVWKYGVVATKYWQDHAKAQLHTCLAANQASCRVSLVTATDDVASGFALQTQLIQEYRADRKDCPTGQWVSCAR